MPSAKKQRAKKKKGASTAAVPKRRSPAIAAAASRIEAANALPKLSAGLEAFLSIDLPAAAPSAATTSPACDAAPAAAVAAADPVRLEIRSPETLGDGDAQGMYDLLKGNMHDMYMEAGWGWDRAEKWREMEHRDARFLIARCGGGGGAAGEGARDSEAVAAATAGVRGVKVSEEESKSTTVTGGVRADDAGTPGGAGLGAEGRGAAAGGERLAGYCHFRFAWDQDENEDGEGVGGTEDVLYVYELQVAPWAKRRGLGRRMMQALEVGWFGPPTCTHTGSSFGLTAVALFGAVGVAAASVSCCSCCGLCFCCCCCLSLFIL